MISGGTPARAKVDRPRAGGGASGAPELGPGVPGAGGRLARVDGRTARAERTRRAIVDALLSLTAEGDLKATAEQIVGRAGVSLRTLWTNFKDLEGLYAAANARLIELQTEHYRPVSPDAPLAVRISAFCEQRGRLLEIAAPAARAAQLRLPYSAQLRRNRAMHHARLRDEIDTVFAREVAEARDREQLARALVLNASWPAWSMLRDDLGLSVETATGVMTRVVSALLCADHDLQVMIDG